MTLTFRWLGVAGLEFSLEGHTLLIDPFFTRPSKLAVLVGQRVPSDRALVARHITRAEWLLVTHPHYDHLLDVPEVLRLTGARAYGTPNTCALLKLHGQAATCIQVGDRLELGPFAVEVFPARHTRIPFERWLNGPLPEGFTSRLPLRLSDYRMDASYSFRIRAGDKTLLVGNHPVPADVVFLSPYRTPEALAALLEQIRPQVVVPVHWEDFMRPLSKPLLPMLRTTAQGVKGFPPVRRISLDVFARQVLQARPGARVLNPLIFEPVALM